MPWWNSCQWKRWSTWLQETTWQHGCYRWHWSPAWRELHRRFLECIILQFGDLTALQRRPPAPWSHGCSPCSPWRKFDQLFTYLRCWSIWNLCIAKKFITHLEVSLSASSCLVLVDYSSKLVEHYSLPHLYLFGCTGLLWRSSSPVAATVH